MKSFPGTKRKGINRVTWDYRRKPPRCVSGVKVDLGGFVGPVVPEGVYKIKLTRGDKVFEKEITLHFDPHSPYSVEDKKYQQEVTNELFKMEENLAYLGDRISWLKDSAWIRAKGVSSDKELEKLVKAFSTKVDTWHATLSASIEGTAITGEEKIREKLSMLFYKVSSFPGRPTDSQVEWKKVLQKNIDDATHQAEEILKNDLPKLNAALAKAKQQELKPVAWEEWDVKTRK